MSNVSVSLILSSGSTGEEVKSLQQRLNVLGFGPLVVDGIFGPATEEAVKKFQKQNGLVVDGIVGPQTRAKLETSIPPTIRSGSTGEVVKYLQQWLNAIGFGSLAVDGIFGPATEEAVKKFQKQYGLIVDGIVGPQTWTKLETVDV